MRAAKQWTREMMEGAEASSFPAATETNQSRGPWKLFNLRVDMTTKLEQRGVRVIHFI